MTRGGLGAVLAVAVLTVVPQGIANAATGNISFSQCANGSAPITSSSTCSWTQGNLNHTNSTYPEGSATTQVIQMTGMPAGQYTVTFEYSTLIKNLHSYDFLTNYNASNTFLMSPTSVCGMAATSIQAACSSGTVSQPLLIQQDPSIAGTETGVTDYSSAYFNMIGGTLVQDTVPVASSVNPCSSTCESVTVTFTVGAGSIPSGMSGNTPLYAAYLTFGAHVASDAQWGPNSGAGSISGSPYHVILQSFLDSTGHSAGGTGGQDNQMQSSAVTGPVPMTLTTTANYSSGTTATDTATIKVPTGSTAPTGSVAFTLTGTSGAATSFSPATQTTQMSDATLVSVAQNVGGYDVYTVTSPNFTGLTLPGGYAFSATYQPGTGGNYVSTQESGGNESFTVAPNAPTLTTTASHASSTATSATDTATLTVPTGTVLSGDVQFTLSGPGGPFTQSVSATNFASPSSSGGYDTYTITSPSFTGLVPGSYVFSALYQTGSGAGDLSGNVTEVSSTQETTNESFTVGPQTPTIATTVNSGGQLVNGVMSGGTAVTGPLTAPASVYDTATVTGIAGLPAPTGFVDFALFQGGCSDGGVIQPEVAPIWFGSGIYSNGVWVSPQVTPALAAGNYYFASYYYGDSNYVGLAGPCEPFTVVTLPPPPPTTPSASISTTPNPSGQSATDTATVTGSGSTPTGTVTFTLYTSGGTAVGNADTETLTNGTATSAAFTNLPPGNYYFVAVYNGSSPYGSVTGSPEPFVIAPLTPTVTTTPSVTGSSASDSVTVSGVTGQPIPGGVVTFTLYDSNGNVVGTPDANVALVNGQATSTTYTGLASGNYYFVATYTSTDGIYSSSVGAHEPLSVTTVSPTKPTKPTKTPPYKIPSKAPTTGLGGSARSGQSGLVESLSALFVLMGLFGLVMTERRRRRA